ncbi:MAG TPA: CvpA family protein [Methylomirabilota bacterium]|nr:CvpA family protein [Methylomirabilota bacterium]
MSIWIVLILLCAIFGGIGYAKGGVRMAVSLFGILLGLALANPLGGAIRPLLASVGLKHPIWNGLLAPMIVFLLVWLVFMGIGFAIHHKLYMRYKYSSDDLSRLKFERMNTRVGIALGLVAAVALLFALGLMVYVLGYATLKVASEESNTGFVKVLSKVREDMRTTGFDRSISSLDRSSPRYYQSIDLFSLLYHNPQLQTRVTNYPPFLRLLEQPEIADAFSDQEYKDMVLGKGSVFQIANHPKTVPILASPTLKDEYSKIDLADFQTYLKTGKAPKFAETQILGRWQFDPFTMVTDMRKKKPDMTSQEIMRARDLLMPLTNATLIATLDNKLVLSSLGAAAAPAAPAAPEDPQATAEAESAAALAARYRTGTPAPQGQARPAAPAQPAKPSVALPMFTGEGAWEGEGSRYKVTLPKVGGGELKGAARIEGDELIVELPEANLTFYRSE